MRKQVLKPHFTIFLLSFLFVLNPVQVYSKDITAKVIKETPLDEHITLFCLTHCIGNERKGTLKSVTVEPAENDHYTVQGKAALRNRQVAGEPFNMTVYDRTIFINSTGNLNPKTCKLRVDDVVVENDFQNIVTNLLKNNSDVIGKVIQVPNCKSFLK